jgi:acylphosphatase
MHKGLRVTLSISKLPAQFLKKYIQRKALQLKLEGTAQVIKQTPIVRIMVYGLKEDVDSFIDFLHKNPGNIKPDSIDVEPCMKERDYRGIFRIIE